MQENVCLLEGKGKGWTLRNRSLSMMLVLTIRFSEVFQTTVMCSVVPWQRQNYAIYSIEACYLGRFKQIPLLLSHQYKFLYIHYKISVVTDVWMEVTGDLSIVYQAVVTLCLLGQHFRVMHLIPRRYLKIDCLMPRCPAVLGVVVGQEVWLTQVP